MIHALNQLLKLLFFFLLIKPIVGIIIGLNIRHRERIQTKGPLVVIANHNSHLDTLVLISLFPYDVFTKIRPVAAADYFLANPFLKWFSLKIMSIIPIDRDRKLERKDPLSDIYESLDNQEIVILFPEGSRGEPEQRQTFKKGISHIAEKYPHVPIIPIFLHGLGKSLPRGDFVLVPFFCDIVVGNPIGKANNREEFMNLLENAFSELAIEGHFPKWE